MRVGVVGVVVIVIVLIEEEGDTGGVPGIVNSYYGVDRWGELEMGWVCRCGSV